MTTGDPTHEADEALLARTDDVALAEIDRRYRPRIQAWVQRRHADPQLADEVAGRTLTRLWEQRDRFDPTRGSTAAWVFVLARTSLADIHREQRRAPVPRSEIAATEAAGRVEDEADRIVTRAVLTELLGRVSADHRTMLRLAFLEGLGHAAIAERLDLPIGTVKTRVFYGLRALRSAAEELGIDLR